MSHYITTAFWLILCVMHVSAFQISDIVTIQPDSGMTSHDNLVRVWERTVDMQFWSQWNHFVVRVDFNGTLALSTPVTLYMYDGTVSHEVISVLNPMIEFCYDYNGWEHKAYLLTTHRCYEFLSLSDGSVQMESNLKVKGPVEFIVDLAKRKYIEDGIILQNKNLKESFGQEVMEL